MEHIAPIMARALAEIYFQMSPTEKRKEDTMNETQRPQTYDDLTPDEKELLEEFHSLTDEGRARVLEFIQAHPTA